MQLYVGEFYAEYCQLILLDPEGSAGLVDEAAFWDKDGEIEQPVSVRCGGRVVSASMPDYAPIWGKVLLEEPDTLKLDGWDHVYEFSLHLESGQLHVGRILYFDQSPDLKLQVSPGWYRVRTSTFYDGEGIIWEGQNVVDETGEAFMQKVKFELWKAPPGEVKVYQTSG